MGFCLHCEGQRFDRAQVLRVLRAEQKRLRRSSATCDADETFRLVIEAVRGLELPHLERLDEVVDGEVVH